MKLGRPLRLGIMLIGLHGAAAFAQETTTYSYDARGRVTNVTRSGGPAGGVSTAYSYDAADNRTNVTATAASGTSGGSATGSGARKIAVAPLGGYKLIIGN